MAWVILVNGKDFPSTNCVREIDLHCHGSSRTSAVRAFIVTYFRTVAGYSGVGSSHKAWMGILGRMTASGQ